MGFPLPRGIKDHDISPQSFLAKAGACLNLFPARMHVLGESLVGVSRGVSQRSQLWATYSTEVPRDADTPAFAKSPGSGSIKAPTPGGLRVPAPRTPISFLLGGGRFLRGVEHVCT